MTYNNSSMDITLAQLAFGDTEPTDLHIFFNLEKRHLKYFHMTKIGLYARTEYSR